MPAAQVEQEEHCVSPVAAEQSSRHPSGKGEPTESGEKMVWFSLHARSSYSSAPQAEHARHCRSWREFCVGAHGVTSNEDELHTVHAKQRLSSDAEQLPSA